MAKPLFILKKEKGSTESTPLLVILHYRCANDQKLVHSTGRKIASRNWSKVNQRAKPSFAQATEFNAFLQALVTRVEAEALAILKAGRSITREELKERITEKRKSADDERIRNNVVRYLENFIAEQNAEYAKGKKGVPEVKASTLKTYGTLQNYLIEFSNHRRKNTITFEELSVPFYKELIKYLKGRESSLKDSSLLKYIGALKSAKKRYNGEVKLGLKAVESDEVFLTEAEIDQLYAHRNRILSLTNGENLVIELDRLVLGCCLGLRQGDNARVEPENVISGPDGITRIRMKTEKTGEPVLIPLLHAAGVAILKRYGNSAPPAVAEQTSNRLFKEVCCIAGINETVMTSEGESVPKWKQVKTHTMRRSFLTNHYLNGVPSIVLMKLSGHKTERAFLRYIRIDRLMAADLVVKHYAEREQKVSGTLVKVS